jgi:hypothetical protein
MMEENAKMNLNYECENKSIVVRRSWKTRLLTDSDVCAVYIESNVVHVVEADNVNFGSIIQ